MPKLFLCALLLSLSTYATALTVTMKAATDGSDKPVVTGTTNLPDGAELLITLSRDKSDYSAQDTTKVKAGAFKAGPFSQGGAGLNPGNYTLEVVMPLAGVQPPPIWPVIGNNGSNLQGPLVKKADIGGKYVQYQTRFKVGNGLASAGKDRVSRAQAGKDAHEWWLQTCKDACKQDQVLARQQNRAFDWDRCYYKCVADEPKKK